ncbi:hypothetical protein AALO_G00195430 [Alosa alosa]|uniref:Uncharacterized protein n=1 Tax=Alosa alosa TaxID=278164 RepID=A0AAV6G6D8_9TELE|nr:hypothetical protein AALO_G00195430 [Alosa alosa]
MEAPQLSLLQQLREMSLSHRETQAKMEEREAQLQELQDTITELHQDISQKDHDKLWQLQQLHHLESRVKELTEEVQNSEETIAQLKQEMSVRTPSSLTREVSTDASGPSGTELLKAELSSRDATIERLRRDLLLSHQARDTQCAQLDVQEQRVCELLRELQERQLELQRGHGRLQQLHRERAAQESQAEQLRAQLSEVRGRLSLVEVENEALLGFKREQGAEVERLSAELSSMRAAQELERAETAEAQRRCGELQAKLDLTCTQLQESQRTTQEAARKAQEDSQELQWELKSLKSQLDSVNQQVGSSPLCCPIALCYRTAQSTYSTCFYTQRHPYKQPQKPTVLGRCPLHPSTCFCT